MPRTTISDILSVAEACALTTSPLPAPPARLFSIWEITQWLLPMAPEHLRRCLAAEPGLPQGSAGIEGGTRWFTATEVSLLRSYFAGRSRRSRYQPARPAQGQAPLIVLTQPLGKTGRSTAALHLASAAALAGYRVLLIDADPAGQLAQALGADLPGQGGGVSTLIAQAAGQHLRQLNESRLDRGEEPLPMTETLSAAMDLHAADLIRPTRWPGLDLLGATAALMQADMQIASWRNQLRSWRPWQALAEALRREGWRQSYDLILCDTGPGLGPLSLAVLASAEVLLAPLSLHSDQAGADLAAGLHGLATAMQTLQAEDQRTARALGQPAATLPWQRLAVLPIRAGADSASRLAGFAAKLGPTLLPAALPEIAQIASGSARNFYDLDYRDLGRLAYAPQREACEAVWRALAAVLTELWVEQTSGQSLLPLR
ncbi:MAG: AAA family ATPase [Cypionkella sp.]|uniref:ParA family protein n=1 Tax=Cypionkella sp. TaxID=2811411 RepID=UPI00272267DD|nr:AAA family ATPase [Cypionkella sp.]MDO8327899.1 AAA family ATPase [Cypionkella sp.]